MHRMAQAILADSLCRPEDQSVYRNDRPIAQCWGICLRCCVSILLDNASDNSPPLYCPLAA